MINIHDWYSEDDFRPWLRAPFTYKGFTVASNGHTAIIAPISSYPPPSDMAKLGFIDELISIFPRLQFKPLAGLSLPEPPPCKNCESTGKTSLVTCMECDGAGELEFDSDFNTYEVDCLTCGGKGETTTSGGETNCQKCHGIGRCYPEVESITFNGLNFQAKYLKLIINDNDLLYAFNQPMEWPPGALFFKTGDYAGVIMPFTI
jgi:hypothetical protein